MEDRVYKIKMYLYDEPVLDDIYFYQNDTNTCTLEFEFYRNRKDYYDLSNSSVILIITKNDGTSITETLTSINGVYQYELSNNAIDNVGNNKITIQAIGQNNDRVTFGSFKYKLTKDTVIGNIASDVNYPILVKLISDANNVITNEPMRIANENTRIENEVKRIANDGFREKDYASLKKIIIDENQAANLQNQINSNNSQLADNVQQVNLKANKTDVDNIYCKKNEVNTLATDKANKTYVDSQVVTINSNMELKASKNEVFTMANMGQDIKEALVNGGQNVAVVGKDAVLEENVVDRQITPFKTNFLLNGKNLFDKSNIIVGKDISPSGDLVDSSNYSTSYFIKVPSNVNITQSVGANIVIFNSAKVALSRKSDSTQNTGATGNYVRISMQNSQVSNYQLEIGTSSTSYEKYKLSIDKLVVPIKDVDGEFITVDTNWNNLIIDGQIRDSGKWFGSNATLDKTGAKTSIVIDTTNAYPEIYSSYSYNFSSGDVYYLYYDLDVLSSNASSFKLGVKIDGNNTDYVFREYATNGNLKGAIKIPIGTNLINKCIKLSFRNYVGVPIGENNKLTTLVNGIMLFKFTGHNSLYNEEMILDGIRHRGGFATGVLNGYLNSRYSDEAINAHFAKEISSQFNGKNFASFGDSLTAMEYWQPLVFKKLQFSKHTNCGIGGTSFCYQEVGGNANQTNSFFQDVRINTIPLDTDLLTIMGGFNDFNKFTKLGDTLPSTDLTTLKGAMCIMIEKLLKRNWVNKDMIILMMTPPYGYNGANPSRDDTPNGKLYMNDICQVIRDVAKFYGLPLLDLWYESGINYVNRDYYLQDLVHPNRLHGGVRIAERVVGKLKTVEPLN